MSQIYGYVRVSSMEQNEERQIIALKDAGVFYETSYFPEKCYKQQVKYKEKCTEKC